jgi:putative FmdB family regulatory protein
MPIYEYRCDNGHTLEVMQRMTDDALSSCTTCDAPVQRVFHPVAVHFKGSGFYATDYGRNNAKGSDEAKAGSGSDDSSSGSSDGGSKSDGSDSKSKSGASESKTGSSESKTSKAGTSSKDR